MPNLEGKLSANAFSRSTAEPFKTAENQDFAEKAYRASIFMSAFLKDQTLGLAFF